MLCDQIEVLQRLQGTLSVAALEDVFEDERHIYLVLELCRGGDLMQRMRSRPPDEQQVEICRMHGPSPSMQSCCSPFHCVAAQIYCCTYMGYRACPGHE